jgi:Vitamin K-dependent gamma-carboxylase
VAKLRPPNRRITAHSKLSSAVSRASNAWLNFWFNSVDSRIYAIFRIAFATVVLINIIEIMPYRHALLSRDGMIDRTTLLTAIGDDQYYSVFHYADSQTAVTVACVLAAAAACALGLGILPRLAAILVWMWAISFSHRAFPAVMGWDNVLRVYSFLIMISPLGSQWSVSNVLRRRQRLSLDPTMAPQYGLQLMRLQLTVIYFDTVWSKVNDPYWRSGELFAYFMRSFYSRIPDFDWENHMIISCLLTYGTLVIEASVPILLWNKKWYWLGFLLGYSLHIGIALLARFSVFSLTIMSVYLSFLDNESLKHIGLWWRRGLAYLRREPESKVLESPSGTRNKSRSRLRVNRK